MSPAIFIMEPQGVYVLLHDVLVGAICGKHSPLEVMLLIQHAGEGVTIFYSVGLAWNKTEGNGCL